MNPGKRKSANRAARSPRKRFRVGDRVKIRFGGSPIIATVIEDRGMIGVGGRQLIRVKAALEFSYPVEFEVASDEVQAA